MRKKVISEDCITTSKSSKNRIKYLSFLISSFIFIGGISSAINSFRRNKEDVQVSKEDIKYLYTAINSNPNLNDEEKESLSNLYEFIEDYYYLIDFDFACFKLNTFDIKYEEIEDVSIPATGTWNHSTNDMTLYLTDDEDIDFSDNPIVDHELLHLISVDNSYFPRALEEGIDSLVISEYDSFNDAYHKQRVITMMLCEIVDPDIIIESYLKKDFSIIEKELLKIDSDSNLLAILEESLDSYQDIFLDINKYYGKDLDDEEVEEAKTYFEDEHTVVEKINDILCHYYTLKTEKEVGNPRNLHMYYPDNYLQLFEDEESIINIKKTYSALFSLYSSSLLEKTYMEDLNRFNYISLPEFKTAYFNKDYDQNSVTFGDYIVIEKDKNQIKQLSKSIR